MHGNGALALPFNDEDLDGADEIVFRVGASVYTATVPAPVATGGLPYGYYAYGSSTDDLGDAVAAALTAADPSETWSCERWTDGLVQKYTLRRTGTAACSLDWNNAGTTFTAEWLGYDSSGNDTGGVTLSDRFYRPPYAPGRVWFPPYTLWTRRDPERVTAHSLGYAGTVEKRRYSVGWKHLDLRHGPVVEARLFKSAVEDFDLNAAVDGLDTADPNFSLESLWDWAATRTPFRYTWDWESTPDDYYSLEVRDNEWLTRFSAPLSLLPDTSPPQWEVTLPMIDYKTTGSDFDLASVVCVGGVVEYDNLHEARQAPADEIVEVTQTANAAKNIPGWTWRAISNGDGTFNTDPFLRRWSWGKIDPNPGLPGSGRTLIVRANSLSAVTMNGDDTMDLNYSTSDAIASYLVSGASSVSVEIDYPTVAAAGYDACISSMPAAVGTSTSWYGGVGLLDASTKDFIWSLIGGGIGLGGGAIFTQGYLAGVVAENFFVTTATYLGVPLRMIGQMQSDYAATTAMTTNFISPSFNSRVSGVPGASTSSAWVSQSRVPFVALLNPGSSDSYSVEFQTFGARAPSVRSLEGGVPS